MEKANKVYRIRTVVGEQAPNVIHVPLNQSYDMFEILSLNLNQVNTYKTYESDYGVVVGRVIANGGFGVPNVKVSVFIPVSNDEELNKRLLYNFTSPTSSDYDGVRYNLLPDFVDEACHQDVGTFPNKRLVLDNKDVIEIFEKYWKYTTTTNHAGDYMLFGIPTGSQQIHIDLDLSDCGVLSQRPHDMMAKGYNETMFESPNKFKTSKNLNSLAQIISQDRGVYVYPYWGDISNGEDSFSITRCDINIEYKFESYAVFMGSIITDQGSNAIGKNCAAAEKNGNMSDLITGEGYIEMIRKTVDGKVEEFPINGNRLIDNDGVWCYKIPMNLDYVMTDEFGNLVPTDNPEKGIATRTRVRFRVSLDETPNDKMARKRARYLIPNNPRRGDTEFEAKREPDYEFGSLTRDESYCDMFWNKVYTVKNYIPKLAKDKDETNRNHTGIKLINHHGDNSPMPYNALNIKLGFTYRFICILSKIVINLIEFLNEILSYIGAVFCLLRGLLELPSKILRGIANKVKVFGVKILKPIIQPFESLFRKVTKPFIKAIDSLTPRCVKISSNFCSDGINSVTFYPGCGFAIFKLFALKDIKLINLDCTWQKTKKNHKETELKLCKEDGIEEAECTDAFTEPENETPMLYNCIENQLAQDNDATSFNFYNDWINGVLYAPLWYRKIKPKKRFFFGLFSIKAKDDWCSSTRKSKGLKIVQHCTTSREKDSEYENFDGYKVEYRRVDGNKCKNRCHKSSKTVKQNTGIIQQSKTMFGQDVYYYMPIEYDDSLPRNYRFNYTNNSKEYIGDSRYNGEVKLLFATDIVLLGSLNDCDMDGIPQFFKTLEKTTYNMPTDLLFTDYKFTLEVKPGGDISRAKDTTINLDKTSEMAGCDWGNPNEFDKYDGGLFYSIGCSEIKVQTKSCINLARVCEYGVSLDETKEIENLQQMYEDKEKISDDDIDVDDEKYSQRLVTDGYISWDELYNLDERSMFATMNGNRLKTRRNPINGLLEYDFRYLYPENFDGSLREIMEERTKKYKGEVNYKFNFKLETASRDYYVFRMGNNPYYYDIDEKNGWSFPRYENSFYFYFGLKDGKTAVEKFNSKFFSECDNSTEVTSKVNIDTKPNSWCSKNSTTIEDVELGYSSSNDGYLALDFSNITEEYNITINGVSNENYAITINGITDDKIMFVNDESELLDGYSQVKTTENAGSVRTYNRDGNPVLMMNNGSYECIVTNDDGLILTEFNFMIRGEYLSFDVSTQDFEQPNNVLIETYHTLANIAKNSDGVTPIEDVNNIRRDIGGVISVYNIFMGGVNLDYYKIEIKPKRGSIVQGEEEYTGISLIYNHGVITYPEGQDGILYPIGSNPAEHHYAFGLPKGGYDYRITVTQICEDGRSSGNSVSVDVTINEPLPYKMFINGIDYELIKNFDNNTGWRLSGTINNSSFSEEGISLDNPWFKVENIYYNEHLVDEQDINEHYLYSSSDILYFTVEKNSETNSFVIYAVTNDNVQHQISVNTLLHEFCTNEDSTTVYYNWVDDYIVEDFIDWGDEDESYQYINEFIDNINDVLENRRQLVRDMKSTFYLSCEGYGKTINITAQTDKIPCTRTIVYHPEVAVENEDYNELDGNKVIVEDIDTIDDIMIPTITYMSNPSYGNGNENSDAPCIVKVGNNKKKPYSVGIMNYSGISIPKKENGESFPNENGDDGAKYIKHSSTNIKDLFNFPLIDAIMRLDYVVWSAFVQLPKYGNDSNNNNQPRKDVVTMNGLLAGIVTNGNIVNGKFDTQTFNDVELVLSPNLVNSSETYIEKHMIVGYNTDSLANWALDMLKTLVRSNLTQEILTKINEILYPIVITENNINDILNSITVENGFLIYNENIRININDIITQILSFTNYITLMSDMFTGRQQYAFALPIMNYLTLEDSDGCGFSEIIDSTLTVELDETSVNDCVNDKKVLAVVSEEDTYYSIFRTDEHGTGYPLNDAVQNGIIWQINKEVYGKYNNNTAPQNLFSFQMKSEDFRNGSNSLVDRNFKSETLISGEDDEEEEYETTRGYGTTGSFTSSTRDNYPVFIVAENNSHVRALSPVYDYSQVNTDVLYGKVHRKNEEEGQPDNVQPVFGVMINNGHFYLDNYRYTLSAILMVDESTTVEISETIVNGTNKLVINEISDEAYNLIESKAHSIIGNILGELERRSNVVAIDYTKLKHICKPNFKRDAITWYAYIWKGNLPLEDGEVPSVDTYGIIVDDIYMYETEMIFKDGENVNIIPPHVYHAEGRKEFLGWSEGVPGGSIITSFDAYNNVNRSIIFYANWSDETPTYTATFNDENDELIEEYYGLHYNDTINPPEGHQNDNWYVGTQRASFPYTITGNVTFKIHEEVDVYYTVTWESE